MGDKAAQIAKDVEEGRMTGSEAGIALAKEYQKYIQKNKKNLSLSKELQEATGINGKVAQETERLANAKSEAEIQKMLEKNNISFVDRDIHENPEEYQLFVEITENDFVPSFMLIENPELEPKTELFAPGRNFEDINEGFNMFKGHRLVDNLDKSKLNYDKLQKIYTGQ